MKPLDKLNNVERAKLLFELLPDEIAGNIQCIKNIAEKICQDPDNLKKQ